MKLLQRGSIMCVAVLLLTACATGGRSAAAPHAPQDAVEVTESARLDAK
jgi:hypothetical protein